MRFKQRISAFRKWLLMLVVGIAWQTGTCHADGPCEYDLGFFGEAIRVVVPGGVSVNGAVAIPLFANPPSYPNDFGDAAVFSTIYEDPQNGTQSCPCVAPGPSPCNSNGSCYSRMEVDIDSSFSTPCTVTYPGPCGIMLSHSFTCTKDHINAFYDHKYDGYEHSGDVDFSMNCYGYAFDCGGWPDDGMYGADALLYCYTPDTTPEDADIAYIDGSHAIKVSGEVCEFPETSVGMVTYTIEKFRSSRIYIQNGSCPIGVDPGKAHPGMSFVLYDGPN
jgi:hypothetical protein